MTAPYTGGVEQRPAPPKPVRKCKTPNCYTKPPAKSLYCLACELDGHAPLIKR